MRAKAVLFIVFAVTLVIAGFAALNMSKQGDASVPKEQVLAASIDLPVGTLLRAQDITWQQSSQTEPDQISRPAFAAVEAKPEIVEETAATVYGAVLRRPLAVGTPIRRGDIVKPGDRDFLQVVLPPGARAIAIPVATGGASTGLLSPGDHVDVILTQNFKNDSAADTHNAPITRRSVGETIVQNLRVLAIDAADTKPVGIVANTANGNFGRTVTMEVTPEQAETINVAAELGKLSLTLRSAQVANIPTAIGYANASDGEKPIINDGAVKPQWAGDVSPALSGAAPQKPIAITPTPVTVLRPVKDPALRREIVKFDKEEDRP
jgi:pilus assembly protein CpaB